MEVTKFIAKEARSFAASVCCVMRKEDFPADMVHVDKVLQHSPDALANGGTCLAGPDGNWIVEPFCNEEKLVVAEIDHARVREERQNMDIVGHYTRPDILQLQVNRQRQTPVTFSD